MRGTRAEGYSSKQSQGSDVTTDARQGIRERSTGMVRRFSVHHLWCATKRRGGTRRDGVGCGARGAIRLCRWIPGIISRLNTLLPKRERGLPRFGFGGEACGGGGGNEQPPLPSLRLVVR